MAAADSAAVVVPDTSFTPVFLYRSRATKALFAELKLTGMPEDTPKWRRIKFLWLAADSSGSRDRQVLFDKFEPLPNGSVLRTFKDKSKLLVEPGHAGDDNDGQKPPQEKVVFTTADGQELEMYADEMSAEEDARARHMLQKILEEQEKEQKE